MRLHAYLSALVAVCCVSACPGVSPVIPVELSDVSDLDVLDVLELPDTPPASPVGLAVPLSPTEVRAGVITEVPELIGGPKADGRLGDVKIYNAQVAFVIEGARRAAGYRVWGGHVVDMDVVRPPGEAGRDRFGEFIPTWNLAVLEPESVEVIDTGADGVATVRVSGHTGEFHWATRNSFVFFDLPETNLSIVHEYTLRPEDTALRLETTVTNVADSDLDIEYPYLLSMQGDGAYAWVAGFGFGEANGQPIPYVGLSGRDLAYGVLAAEGDLRNFIDYSSISIMERDPYALAAGQSATFVTHYTVTEDGPTGLDAAYRALIAPGPAGEVTGTVSLPPTATADEAWVALWSEDAPRSMAPVTEEGTYALTAPPGAYQLVAYALDHAASDPVSVTIVDAESHAADIAVPPAGELRFAVTDAAGDPTAARITVLREEGAEFDGPPTSVLPLARREWEPEVQAFAYAVVGEASVKVPAGTYEVVASHGFTAELDVVTVTVGAGEVNDVALTVVEVVDTSGYVAADFHIHSGWSWDSHVSPEVRAIEAHCEGIDMPILTEHGSIAGLDEVSAAVGLDGVLVGPAGQEVTTFTYGHFNAFPVEVKPEALNRGAVYALDKDPLDLFAAMRALRDDLLIQVNHPRNSVLGGFFAWTAFNPATGTSNSPHWTTDFDAVEVFNGTCGGDQNYATLTDWVSLTNHGHTAALSSGSDSHSQGVPIGMPRNYIRAELSDLQADPAALVAAVRGRQMVVSCGPFLRVSGPDGVGPGSRVTVDAEGRVVFDIRVEAPSWMSITTLRLLEDGVIVQEQTLAGVDPVVRFDGQLEVTPSADAWYSVQVEGEGSVAPVAWRGHPFAMSNPIEVDADGDGVWTPPGS